jgi:hypothetical protein
MTNIALNDLFSIIQAQLTPEERDRAVAYAVTEPIPAGTKRDFPRITIEAKSDSLLAFVDREPMANWSHSCRYILLNIESRDIDSFEASLPPFSSNKSLNWRVIYKAPSVPDALLAVGS